ncbi:sugar/carbohydrate kinase [Haematococcus lacustris]
MLLARQPGMHSNVQQPRRWGATGSPRARQPSGSRRALRRCACQASLTAGATAVPPQARSTDKRADVVALGNLCCDVVLQVPQLPPADVGARQKLLAQLTSDPPAPTNWEVGGTANFMIAAARLGLKVSSIAHLGRDSYGDFTRQVLQAEHITDIVTISPGPQLPQPCSRQLSDLPGLPKTNPTLPTSLTTSSTSFSTCTNTTNPTPIYSNGSGGSSLHSGSGSGSGSGSSESQLDLSSGASKAGSSSGGGEGAGTGPLSGTVSDPLAHTLVCFVLVDPAGRHAFCSRYDFGPWPLLAGVRLLPPATQQLLQSSRAVFLTGFVFDELPLELVTAACHHARSHGAAIFFDPGPRCHTMKEGHRQHALQTVMDLSDVILMTEEEAVVVTGLADAEAAACVVLARPHACTQWCVVKQGARGALLKERSSGCTHTSPGMQVPVKDTVGCGDSFAAAIVWGYIHGHPVGTTLALANAVGAATAMGQGAGRNVANADTVIHLLESAPASVQSTGDTSQALSLLRQSIRSPEALAM